jgi:putative ATP-dependent DNA ligase
MDGYNIRIKRIDDRLYAFTRGGLVCPFTMDRLQELIVPDFFERYPDYTLCGEIVGRENPYNSEPVGFIEEDIRFYAFDIKDREGRSIPLYDRYLIFKEENIQAVRRWGPYRGADIEKIKAILLELDREEREGVVIKSIDGSAEVKYVTLGSCIRDIEATASFFPELPAGFYMQRLIRILAILDEFGLPLDGEIKSRIVNVLLEPMIKTIKNVKRSEQIKEFFRIRVNSKDTADELIRHLRHMGVNARLVSIERAGKHYLVTFYRTYHRGARLLRKRLKGHGFYD